jgi:transposase
LNGAWQKAGSERPIFGTRRKGKAVLVWGAICRNGKTQLIIVNDQKYNASAYQRTLERGLKGVGKRLFAGSPWVFMHDGAPTHTAKSTIKWLDDNGYTFWKSGKGGIWPPYSPDLNPIENLWAVMKNQVYRARPKTREQLIRLIRKCWNSMTPEFIRHFVDDVPDRLNTVIQKSGGSTRH